MKTFLTTFTLLLFIILTNDSVFLKCLSNIHNDVRQRYIFDSYKNIRDFEDFPNICDDYGNETCAEDWINRTDVVEKRNRNRIFNAIFEYATNIKEINEKKKTKFKQKLNKLDKKYLEKARKFQWQYFKSSQLKRIFSLITPSVESKNESISEIIVNISQEIENVYMNAQPCFEKCLEKGEFGIVDVFRKERDYDKLIGYWIAWRNVTGRKIRNSFIKRMNLENEGARENGFSDSKSFEINQDFEDLNFTSTVNRLYEEILPFYKELHAYVRYCLSKVYPNRFNETGPIPAHILGNVWAQEWNNIIPIINQCRQKVVSNSMYEEANKKLKTMSIKEYFKMSETFFVSLGMYEMTPNFWERSVIEKKEGKLMDCHGAAYDFSNTVDFRISMCTEKNIDDFTVVHHEMGHIEHFMAYKDLLYPFQASANSGFHEAIGDTIALSVKTPGHLERMNIIPKIPSTEDSQVDYLLETALEKVVFLPFALTADEYVWSVYNGSVPQNKFNQHWWDLRTRFQGLMPPVQRTEQDFDPGAKFHIAFGIPYIRYFISFILQFQFYEAMCESSHYSGPLHLCDFYGSKEAGRKLLEMLKKGRSQHWTKSLSILTGSEHISTKSLMTYFEPLYKWLKKTNQNLNVPVGW